MIFITQPAKVTKILLHFETMCNNANGVNSNWECVMKYGNIPMINKERHYLILLCQIVQKHTAPHGISELKLLWSHLVIVKRSEFKRYKANWMQGTTIIIK